MRSSVLTVLLACAGSCAAEEIKVACWNVENLFDEVADGAAPDAPVESIGRVREKLAKDAEILRLLDADIVGLVEVENRRVLRMLVQDHLKGAGYDWFCVIEETDSRGIDTGLIARRPFTAMSFAVPGFSRGILGCRFTAAAGEPFWVLVNHWKSRFGGGADRRMACAERALDVVRREIPRYEGRDVPVLLMGDLNDEATDASVRHLLRGGMEDLLADLPPEKRWTIPYHDRGARKLLYQGFDHILANGALMSSDVMGVKDAEVVFPRPMKMTRNIEGREQLWPMDDYRDRIGYSDHLPVRVTLVVPDPPPTAGSRAARSR